MAYCSAGKPKASQPIGMQDVKAARAAVAGEDIGGGVAFGVADVQSGPGRVGEHVEDVVLLRQARVPLPERVPRGNCFPRIPCPERLLLFPVLLPFRLNQVKWILLARTRHKAGNIKERFLPSNNGFGAATVSNLLWLFQLEPSTVPGMESLHAPWRIQYILAPKPAQVDGSLFARIGQSNEDEANYVVARDRTCFAMLNTYPYNGGHLLVIPYRQVADLNDLTEEELCGLMKLTRRGQGVLAKLMKPDGFNIGLNLGKVAGAGIVEHLHIHIVPRWMGDTNFMPILASTTVLPEALSELASKLRAGFASERN